METKNNGKKRVTTFDELIESRHGKIGTKKRTDFEIKIKSFAIGEIIKEEMNIKVKKSNITTLDQFTDKHYGKKGTTKRDKLETGYQNFKIGVLLHQARLEKGLTQEQLTEKVGTTKSYISKIENNIKEARISTLQKKSNSDSVDT